MFWLALLLCCTATLALPLPDEVDSDESRKVLGSSVVTSVSVITDLGNGTPGIFADATGQQVQKPITGGDVGSPVNMATPDHYQYYSFDGSGNLIKRYMTKDDVSSIIATNQKHSSDKLPDSPTFYHNMPANIGDLEFETTQDGEEHDNLRQAQMRVHSVVASVQNVLKSQMHSQAEVHPEIPAHSTPDTSASWTMILPSFFGNHASSEESLEQSTTDDVPTRNVTESTNSTDVAGNQQPTLTAEIVHETPATEVTPVVSETHEESATTIINFTESVTAHDDEVKIKHSSESQMLGDSPAESGVDSSSSEKYETIPFATSTKDSKPALSTESPKITQIYFKKKTPAPTTTTTVETPADTTISEVYTVTTGSTLAKNPEPTQSTESEESSEIKHQFTEVPLMTVPSVTSHQPEKLPEPISEKPAIPSVPLLAVTSESYPESSQYHQEDTSADDEISSDLTKSDHELSTQSSEVYSSETVSEAKPAQEIEHVNVTESVPMTEIPVAEDEAEIHKVNHFSEESVMLGDSPADSSENSEEKHSSQSTETIDQPETSTEHKVSSEEKDASHTAETENSSVETKKPDVEREDDDHSAHDDDDEDDDDDDEEDDDEDENDHDNSEEESDENVSSTDVHTTVVSDENIDKSVEKNSPVSSEESDASKEQTSSESTQEVISSDEHMVYNKTSDSDSKINSEDVQQSLTTHKPQPSSAETTTTEEQTSSTASDDRIHTVSDSDLKNANQDLENVQADKPFVEHIENETQSHSTESYESFEKVTQSEENASLMNVDEQPASTSAEGVLQNEDQTAYNADIKTSSHESENMQADNPHLEQIKEASHTDEQKVAHLEHKPHSDLANTLVLSEENHSSFNQIETSKETSSKIKNSSLAEENQSSQIVDSLSPEASESSYSKENPLPNSSNVNVHIQKQPGILKDSDGSSNGFIESSVSAAPEKTTDTSSSTPEVTADSEITEVQDASNIKETFVDSSKKDPASNSSGEASDNSSSTLIVKESTTEHSSEYETSSAENDSNASEASTGQSDSTVNHGSSYPSTSERTPENESTEIVVTSVSTSKSTHTSSSKVTTSPASGENYTVSETGNSCGGDDSNCTETHPEGNDKTGASSESVEVTSKIDTQDPAEDFKTQLGLNSEYIHKDTIYLTETPLIQTKPSIANSDILDTLTTTFTEPTTSGNGQVTSTSMVDDNTDIIPISNEIEGDAKNKPDVTPLVKTTEVTDPEGSGNDSGTEDCEAGLDGNCSGSGSGSGDGSVTETDASEETTEGSGDVETTSQESGWHVTKPIPIGGKNTYKASDEDTIHSMDEEMQDIMSYANSSKDIGVTKVSTLEESGETFSNPIDEPDDSVSHNTDKRNDDVYFTTTVPNDAELETSNKSSSNETQESSQLPDIVEYGNSNSDIGITNTYNASETESTEPFNVEMTTVFDDDLMMSDGHLHDPTDDVDDESDDSMMLGDEQFLKDFSASSSTETAHKGPKPYPVKTQKVDIVENVELNTKFSTSGGIPITFSKKPTHTPEPEGIKTADDPTWAKLELVSPLENVPLQHRSTTTIKPAQEKIHDEEPLDPGHHSLVEKLPQFYSPASVELHPAPQESLGLEASTLHLVEDVQQFAELCNELAFKLWVSMTDKGVMSARSLVMSPFAVTSLLAMIFLGAKGSTSGQMNDMLKLDDMMTFNPHQVFKNVTESVVQFRNPGVRTAAFVRELYSDKSKGPLLDFYKQRASQFYDGLVEEANFTTIGDVLRRRTNLLIKKQTGGRVPEYLRGSSLQLQPPLAAFSANIFQTECRGASTEGRDGEMYFTILPATRQRRLVPIPAAVFSTGFLAGYEPSLDATVVSLGMQDSSISTLFVLPGQQGQTAPGDGLARLETRLIATAYSNRAWSRLLRSLLQRPGLEIQIPRFSHRSLLNVTHSLQHMGLNDLFNPVAADLKGLSGVKSALHVSDIVQVNTFTTCGEEVIGSRHHVEIYPATPQRNSRDVDGVSLVSRPRQARVDLSLEPSGFEEAVSQEGINKIPLALRPRQARLPDGEDSLPRLKFDRPFLYFVRHNPTGFILHMGRFNPRLLH